MESSRKKGQSGFTLIELLVAIAVLGTMSGATVVGVGAFRAQAQKSACAADRESLGTAEEAAFVSGGSHLAEDALVKENYLGSESTMHDVTLTEEGYELVPVGDCIVSTEELADGAAEAAAEKEAAAAAEEKAAAEKAAAEKDAEKKAQEAAATEEAAKAAEEAKAADAAKAAEAAPDDALTEEEARKAAEQAKAEEIAKAEAAAKEAEAAKAKEGEAGGTTGCKRGQVDINSAAKKSLTKIDHVGGDEAERIVKQRPFKNLEQLTTVKGLEPGDVKDIIEQGLACVA
jgi:prepilin-type N-terminal cleavage/methylation domain-containing protein